MALRTAVAASWRQPVLPAAHSIASSSSRALPSYSPRRLAVAPTAVRHYSSSFISSRDTGRSRPSTTLLCRSHRPIASSIGLRAAPVVGAARSLSLWPFGGSNKEQAANEASSSTLERTKESAQQLYEQGKEKASELSSQASDAARSAADSVSASAQQATASAQSGLQSASQALDTTGNSVPEAATDVATAFANEFHAAGLPNAWAPASWAQYGLDYVTAHVGLPWWMAIIGMTVTIRLLLAPLVIKLQANNIRLANIQPQMQEMMKDVQAAKARGDMAEMSMAAKKVQGLMKTHDANPFKSIFVPFLQMPIFITIFFALRGMATAGLPSMATGGFGWVENLTLPDPYWALPITSALATLAVVETGAEMGAGAGAQTEQQKTVRNVMRGILVLTPWLVSGFPAAVLLFWTTNNIFSLAQFAFLRTDYAKKVFKLPKRIDHPKPAAAGGKKAGSSGGFMDGFRKGMDFVQARDAPAAASNPYANYGGRYAAVSSGAGRPQGLTRPSAHAQAAPAAYTPVADPATAERERALRNLTGGEGASSATDAADATAGSAAHGSGSTITAAEILREEARAQKELAKQKRVQASRDRRHKRSRI